MEKKESHVRSGRGPRSQGLQDEEAQEKAAYPTPETPSNMQPGGFSSSRTIASCASYVLLAVLASIFVVAVASQLSCRPTRNLEIRSDWLAERATQASATDSATASATPLVDFQVYQPVLTPTGPADQKFNADGSTQTESLSNQPEKASCTVTLMVHEFAYSYGVPYVGSYTPPDCVANANRATMNLTVTSKGRQYDRLALMYLGDTEVFRTSTAEPSARGIIWTYLKDMSHLFALWKQPQKVIFDLGNIVNSVYTGHYNTTLTITFFTTEDVVNPADAIIPISSHSSSSNSVSAFTLPSQNASNTVSFPQNVKKAVFSILASGGGTEEFWWGNVLSSDIDTFIPADGELYGYSPFRELQLFIDGQLAGVQWPFPIIFTGGVVPGLWRPIVGLDAFDLREHEIDISAWLPLLCDGAAAGHTFEIKVAGIDDDGKGHGTLTSAVGSAWTVTGKIFIWYDEKPGWVTTGTHPVAAMPAPAISLSSSYTQIFNGTSMVNDTLTYRIDVARQLSFTSTVITSNGTQEVSWAQDLKFSNKGYYTSQGNTQVVDQSTTGTDTSSSGYKTVYSYPAWVNTTQWFDPNGSGNFTLDATMNRGLSLEVDGEATFPTGLQVFTNYPGAKGKLDINKGSKLSTAQNGIAYYMAAPSLGYATGFGSTKQDFSFGGYDINEADFELYKRHVSAVNSTVIEDQQILVGVTLVPYAALAKRQGSDTVVLSQKAALGRGKGQAKPNLVDGNRS